MKQKWKCERWKVVWAFGQVWTLRGLPRHRLDWPVIHLIWMTRIERRTLPIRYASSCTEVVSLTIVPIAHSVLPRTVWGDVWSKVRHQLHKRRHMWTHERIYWDALLRQEWQECETGCTLCVFVPWLYLDYTLAIARLLTKSVTSS